MMVVCRMYYLTQWTANWVENGCFAERGLVALVQSMNGNNIFHC